MKTQKLKISTSYKSYLFLAPFGIIFIIFTLVPILSSIFLSFTYFNMLELPKFSGFDNFIRLFLDDEVFLIALKNTIIFAIIIGPIGFMLSFVLAWLVNELPRISRSVVTLLFYTPTLAGNVFFIWLFIFGGDSYSLLNSQLMKLGLITEPIPWLTDPKYNFYVCIAVILWMSAGTGFLALRAGLQSLNFELFEAGAIDGIRNRWQELWYITLPQMKPQLLLTAVFSISGSFAVGYQNAVLTGFPSTDYSTHTILLHIQDFGFVRYEMGYASAVQLFLFTVMLITWYTVNRFLAKWGSD